MSADRIAKVIDLAQRGNEILAAAHAEDQQPTGRLRLYTTAELAALAAPIYLIEPFVVERSLTVLFGPTGTFKTFVAIDWASRAPGLAVYVSPEGSRAKLGRRGAAWEQAAGRPGRVLWHPDPVNL